MLFISVFLFFKGFRKIIVGTFYKYGKGTLLLSFGATFNFLTRFPPHNWKKAAAFGHPFFLHYKLSDTKIIVSMLVMNFFDILVLEFPKNQGTIFSAKRLIKDKSVENISQLCEI